MAFELESQGKETALYHSDPPFERRTSKMFYERFFCIYFSLLLSRQ